MVGDRDTDIEFARNLGIRGFKLGAPGDETWAEIAHELVDRPRVATVQRKTSETDIRVGVDLDVEARAARDRPASASSTTCSSSSASTAASSSTCSARGDLHIDEHHTVEDVALTLGQALREALGDKRGIQRYGFLLPMDEADVEVSIDLGGRPYLVFEGAFPRERRRRSADASSCRTSSARSPRRSAPRSTCACAARTRTT